MADTLKLTGTMSLQAAHSEGKRPSFTINAYNGGPMTPEVTGNMRGPVIIDLAGISVDRPSGRIPILFAHDPERVLGSGAPTITDNGVSISGDFTGDNADSQNVIAHGKGGFDWQASIGGSIGRREFLAAGQTAVVNGRQVQGPLNIIREFSLKETSILAIGADSQTSAAIAASPSLEKGNDMNFEAWLAAKGIDSKTLEEGAVKATLKAAFDSESKVFVQTPVLTASPAVAAPAATPTAQKDYGTLEEVFAGNKLENKRKSEITRIAAECLRDNPSYGESIEIAARKAIDEGTTPNEFELALLRACRPATGGRRGSRVSGDSVTNEVLEAALCRATGLSGVDKMFDDRTLTACDQHFRDGIGIKEVIVRAANDRGASLHAIRGDSSLEDALHYAMPSRAELRASSGFSTISLPNILANVQNKFLREAFLAVESTWREISAITSVSDFKAISRMSLTGDLQYQQVTATGEIPHGTLSELAYSNQAKTYGKMLAITREMIINDDLSAFAQVPRRLGRGAALKINDVFWTAFLDNSSFFTTGNSNYDSGTDTALDTAGLTKALGTFWYAQTDPDGKPLGVDPAIMLVPPGQWIPAMTLNGSTAMNPSGQTSSTALVGNLNPFAGQFRVLKSTYLANSSYTGYSALAWYLLCNPSDIPVIEVVFLGGREMPIVETAEADFDQLGIKIRAYHDFGVTKQEYRGGMKFKGEA